MAVQFSFTERQWWATVAAAVLIVVLLAVVGFLAGALWQRRRVVAKADAALVPCTALARLEKTTINREHAELAGGL